MKFSKIVAVASVAAMSASGAFALDAEWGPVETALNAIADVNVALGGDAAWNSTNLQAAIQDHGDVYTSTDATIAVTGDELNGFDLSSTAATVTFKDNSAVITGEATALASDITGDFWGSASNLGEIAIDGSNTTTGVIGEYVDTVDAQADAINALLVNSGEEIAIADYQALPAEAATLISMVDVLNTNVAELATQTSVVSASTVVAAADAVNGSNFVATYP